jgi:hypothetical protein
MICLIKLGGKQTLQAPLSAQTVHDLINYMDAVYTNLFAGSKVIYPDQCRARFLHAVLKDGYAVPLATDLDGPAVIDLETVAVTRIPNSQLDHSNFSDPHAWKLMTGMYLATQEEN